MPAKPSNLRRRQPERARSADLLADRFVALWDDIRAGRYRPEAIRQKMWPYSTEVQLPKLFAMHRELAR